MSDLLKAALMPKPVSAGKKWEIWGGMLRAERHLAGLTLGDTSRATGIGVSRLSAIERGYAPEPTHEERDVIWRVVTAYRAGGEGWEP
ncbi:MAG: helix-turn-helix transcriptional regulator [Polyangiaceae bacterium]